MVRRFVVGGCVRGGMVLGARFVERWWGNGMCFCGGWVEGC